VTLFAEGQAVGVADQVVALICDTDSSAEYDGRGLCYVEFGHESVARVDVTFLTGAAPAGGFDHPSPALADDKREFGTSRARRWFGTVWPAEAPGT
jgi:sulfide:quinone oxidoreductase